MAPTTRSSKVAVRVEKDNAKVRATAKGAKATAGAEAKAEAKAKADAEANAEAKAKAKANTKSDGKAKAAAKREEAWYAQYRELRRFHELNGHTNVPQKKNKKRGENDEGEDSTGGEDSAGTKETEEPSLAKLRNWVKKQRDYYAKLQRGEKSPLTQARIDRLNEIDFVFDVYGDKWNAQFKKLQDYAAVFEHCDVPINDKDYGDLGRWVKLQRENHREWQKGKKGEKSPLMKEREAALEALGFKWELNNRTKGAACKPNITADTSGDSK